MEYDYSAPETNPRIYETLPNNGSDYQSAYDAAYGSGGIPVGFVAVYLAVLVLMFVSFWKIFVKAGKPGWAGIIPIYNYFVMLEVVGRPVWWLLLFFIPIVGLVTWTIVVNDLAKSFGKSTGYTVGLILLPFVFWPMLAFGSAKYGGPSVKSA